MTPEKNTTGITLRDILWMAVSRWYWFVISLAICIALGIYTVKKTEPVYSSEAQLLIKDQDKGNSSSSAEMEFANMGMLKNRTNIQNEILTMTSLPTIREVVGRLNLDVNYTTDGRLYNPTVYGSKLPVLLSFPDLGEEGKGSLTAVVGKDGSLTLGNFAWGTGNTSSKTVKAKSFQQLDTVSTPMGRIAIAPNPAYVPGNDKQELTLYVTKSPLTSAAKSYKGRVDASIPEKASVIQVKYNDVSTERANDFLSVLIEVYNQNWISDKNRISVSTSDFIKERLAVIENELGNVDSDISSFKSSHMLPDVQQASTLYFQRATVASDEVLAYNNRLGMARYIRNYLSNSANSFNVLPANSGLENLSIEGQISNYNELLLKRNQLVSNSSTSNPYVVDIDNQLAGMREAILTSIDNYIVMLNSQVQMARSSQAMASSQLAANPTQARYLLSVERQQKVKESLYLYLLQKREENELSQAFTAYNTRVIAPPAQNGLVAPLANRTMLIFLLIGLAIPTAAIYLVEMFNTKVRGRRDIEPLSVPFLGEIPLGYHKRHGLQRLRPARDNEKDQRVVMVRKGCGNTINEAFRVIRTNLELMADADNEGAHVIMLTSANPGSGKTFITINTASVLAIKEKRVCVLDLDLRKGSISSFVGSPAVGVSAFLSGHATLQDIMCKVNVTDKDNKPTDISFDLIPAGAIPPNPAELLYSPRLKSLLDNLRKEYDYVLVDCPPVEVVADAKIINRHADLTIFIIRAGLLEREMLGPIQQFYDNQRYHNMAIILNGTDSTTIAGLGSRYGYGYGYGYGYSLKGKEQKK